MSHPNDDLELNEAEQTEQGEQAEQVEDDASFSDEELPGFESTPSENGSGNGRGVNEANDAGSETSPRPRPRRRRPEGRPEGRPAADDDRDYTGDERAVQALGFVTDIVREMEMDCLVRLRRPREENAENEINIDISGKDAGRIIGKKGQVLQALQFLTHRIINRPGLERRHILVDAEGYRSRRDNSLASMARRLGKQAVEEGKIITFEPMNPRDRRVVHLALAKFEGVITKSDGEGDDRRVQIIPVRR